MVIEVLPVLCRALSLGVSAVLGELSSQLGPPPRVRLVAPSAREAEDVRPLRPLVLVVNEEDARRAVAAVPRVAYAILMGGGPLVGVRAGDRALGMAPCLG